MNRTILTTALTLTVLAGCTTPNTSPTTNGAVMATRTTGQDPTDDSVAGQPHGLPTDNPMAARAEVRRRMIAEWNTILDRLPLTPTRSGFAVFGDERRHGTLSVDFPTVPQDRWDEQDHRVEEALLATGWRPPRRGMFEHTKNGYRIIGGCRIDGCNWTMYSPMVGPILDQTSGTDDTLPDLHRAPGTARANR